MQITLTGVDIGLALIQYPAELMIILATVADFDMQEGGGLIDAVAARFNGSPYHTMVAPFLRELADAIDAGSAEVGDAA